MPKRTETRSTTTTRSMARSTAARTTTARRRAATPASAGTAAQVGNVVVGDPLLDTPRPLAAGALDDADPNAAPLAEEPVVAREDDVVDPDLRYRMISEAAYRRYAERNYADGYDFDDWLQAESEIDSLLRNPRER